MRPWIGTTGWSYYAWKGAFYPEKIGSSETPGYRAGRLWAVVFFKHEVEGTGPSLAGRMLEALGGRP